MSKCRKPNDDMIECVGPFAGSNVMCFVKKAQKGELISAGRARSIDHGKRLRLTSPYDSLLQDSGRVYRQTLDVRPSTIDDSGRMGEHVMIANADEEAWAREITAAWRGNQAGLDSERGINLSASISEVTA